MVEQATSASPPGRHVATTVVAVSALTYDISYSEARSRLTNAFRIISAIPHLIVAAVWGYFAEILAFIQWFIIVFTGKRNRACGTCSGPGSATPVGWRATPT